MTPQELTIWAKKWADKLWSAEMRRMSDDEAQILTTLLLMCSGSVQGLADELADEFLFKIVSAHANQVGLEMDLKLQAFLSLVLTSPGNCRMLCVALRTRYSSVTLAKLCATEIALGLPTKETLDNMWDAQKDDEGRNKLVQLVPEMFS